MEPYPGAGVFSPWTPGLLSFLLYGAVAFTIICLLLFLTAWLGEKKGAPEKATPFECGIRPTGPARYHHPVPFYLIAFFFLVFDVEGIYILSWAIAVEPLGWSGWLQISFFIIVLLISLFYLWKKGGLEWGPKPGRKPASPIA